MLTPMETPRLLLRRPMLSDADDLFSILSDAETCRMDGNYPPYSQKNEAFYADVRALADDGDNRLFLEERSTGRMVGLLHVMPADGPNACEIGFVVRLVNRVEISLSCPVLVGRNFFIILLKQSVVRGIRHNERGHSRIAHIFIRFVAENINGKLIRRNLVIQKKFVIVLIKTLSLATVYINAVSLGNAVFIKSH